MKQVGNALRTCERNKQFYENQAELLANFISKEIEEIMDSLKVFTKYNYRQGNKKLSITTRFTTKRIYRQQLIRREASR